MTADPQPCKNWEKVCILYFNKLAAQALAALEMGGGSSSSSRGEEKEGDKASLETLYQSKTKAELTFLKRRQERDAERVRKKATLTHKEKVNKFNTYLSTLSEHYDIPKVSWTK